MVHSRALLAFTMVVAACLACDAAVAQEHKPAPAAPVHKPARAPKAPAAPAAETERKSTEVHVTGAKWTSQCTSASRHAEVECTMEQSILLNNTRQLLALIVIRMPANLHEPVMTIQVPVGLFLPAGLSLQIDEGKPLSVPLQTCDLKGCYATTPIAKDMIEALKGGKRLAVTFENNAKEKITVPFALDSFADAYAKIQ
jgi:invasion protein IalB